jgi:hypothetical protein
VPGPVPYIQTPEIMRNILAERVLGLAKDGVADRG